MPCPCPTNIDTVLLQGERELAALPKLEESEQIEQLRKYYDLTSRLMQISETLLSSLANSSISTRVFNPGRVIILGEGVSFVEIGIGVETESDVYYSATPVISP